jgi:hypothetical protein
MEQNYKLELKLSLKTFSFNRSKLSIGDPVSLETRIPTSSLASNSSLSIFSISRLDSSRQISGLSSSYKYSIDL